jgi:hypothetical protein
VCVSWNLPGGSLIQGEELSGRLFCDCIALLFLPVQIISLGIVERSRPFELNSIDIDSRSFQQEMDIEPNVSPIFRNHD